VICRVTVLPDRSHNPLTCCPSACLRLVEAPPRVSATRHRRTTLSQYRSSEAVMHLLTVVSQFRRPFRRCWQACRFAHAAVRSRSRVSRYLRVQARLRLPRWPHSPFARSREPPLRALTRSRLPYTGPLRKNVSWGPPLRARPAAPPPVRRRSSRARRRAHKHPASCACWLA